MNADASEPARLPRFLIVNDGDPGLVFLRATTREWAERKVSAFAFMGWPLRIVDLGE